MDKDTYVEKVEKIIHHINSLNFQFSDSSSQSEADRSIELVVEELETYLNLVEEDEPND